MFNREIHFHDGTRRAFGHALGTQPALVIVYIREISTDCNRLKLAYFLTLPTADTGSRTGFAGSRPLVPIHTAHIHPTVLGTVLAKLDDMTRTCLHAGATARA